MSLSLLWAACPGPGGQDAGIPDAGVHDAGVHDAGAQDAGVPDAGGLDAGLVDADAGAAALDAGPLDAAAPDAAAPDAASVDAGPAGVVTEKLPGTGLHIVGAGPALATCVGCDLDLDGLDDQWEQAVLEAARPAVRLSDDEPHLTDDDAVLAQVGRVELVALAPVEVRVYVMLGYSEDYGSCGLTAHHGDSERVALVLRGDADDGAGNDMWVTQAYTAAHEGTATDHGRVYVDEALDTELVYAVVDGATRWVVAASEAKHATYGNATLCADAFFIPCLVETCAPDDGGVVLLPPVINAGEPDAPLVTDLGPLGFAGDDAWADQPFCGGTPMGGCSSPVREKLLNNPF